LIERSYAQVFPDERAPRRTCDDALTSLWQALLAEQPSACPLCGGRMEPRVSAGAGVVGGRCRSCGTEIA
jgi:hypothetical protein